MAERIGKELCLRLRRIEHAVTGQQETKHAEPSSSDNPPLPALKPKPPCSPSFPISSGNWFRRRSAAASATVRREVSATRRWSRRRLLARAVGWGNCAGHRNHQERREPADATKSRQLPCLRSVRRFSGGRQTRPPCEKCAKNRSQWHLRRAEADALI